MTFPAHNRKPKVSIVVSDLSSKGAGRWGGAIRPFLLAQALRQLDCDVEMLGVAFGEPSPAIAEWEFPIISFPCQEYSGFVQAASKLIKQINGSIIYAVKLKPSSFGLALIKKYFTGRPLILDIDDWELSWHGGDRWQYNFRPKQIIRDLIQPKGELKHPDHPLYLKWIEKLAYQADVITLHNQFLQKRFGGIYLPNGKNTSLFDPTQYDPETSRAKYGLSDYTILMFPGAPRPYKGVEDVLIALDRLNRSDLRLVIVGGSPYDDYDLQLQKQWGKWIVQLPKSPVEKMPEIIACAHIIVVPQRDSPATQAQFPLKLTDGMAMAKPILASRVGDIPQILGDTGYLVEADSPEQIATTLELILNDLDTANTKAIAARTRCIEHYSIEAMAEILKPILANFQ